MTLIDEPDQEERIIKLRQEIEKHGGIVPEFDLSPDDEEQALREMLNVESVDEISLLDLLTHRSVGVKIPSPDQLDSNAVAPKLKEIIDRMASLKAYLLYTNHFSDPELYEYLYRDVLPLKSALLSMNCAFVIDCTGCVAGSYEGRQLFLTYYADEEQREEFAQGYPDEPMPEHEDPPFDRDRFLPQVPLG